MRKTLISDEPVPLNDILAMQDGGPEEEQPFNPIPERPKVDEEADKRENEKSPVPPPPTPAGEPVPAQPGHAAQSTTPLMGSEYSAPVMTPSTPLVTYRSRISIVEAWRYPGQLAEAPDFIDRSWTAWGEADLHGHSAGPALRIPVTRSLSGPVATDGSKLCRIGDYVVRQMVTIVDTVDEEAIDVWPKEEFERLFIPCSKSDKAQNRRKAA